MATLQLGHGVSDDNHVNHHVGSAVGTVSTVAVPSLDFHHDVYDDRSRSTSDIELSLHKTFKTYDELKATIEQREKILGEKWVKSAGSRTVRQANSTIQNPSKRYRSDLEYVRLELRCVHEGYFPSKVAKENRVRDKMSQRIGCPVKMTLVVNRSKDVLQISKLELNHSHETGPLNPKTNNVTDSDTEPSNRNESMDVEVKKEVAITSAYVKVIPCRVIATKYISVSSGEVLRIEISEEEDEPAIIDVYGTGKLVQNLNANGEATIDESSILHIIEDALPVKPKVLQPTLKTQCIKTELDPVARKESEVEDMSQEKSASETDCTALTCVPCLKSFSSEELYEKHLQNHEKQTCKLCRTLFRSKAMLESHREKAECCKEQEQGKDLFVYKCKMCSVSFPSEAYLSLHIDQTHKTSEEKYTCSDCHRTFLTLTSYNRHKNGRPCSKPYVCDICNKFFPSSNSEKFKKHMRIHKDQASGTRYTCETCGKSYLSNPALMKHKMIHHSGKKGHACPQCGKEFALNYMVRDHMKTHTDLKSFLCSICGQGFRSSSHLSRHLHSHSKGTLHKRGRPRNDSSVTETGPEVIEISVAHQGVNAGPTPMMPSGSDYEVRTHDGTIPAAFVQGFSQTEEPVTFTYVVQ